MLIFSGFVIQFTSVFQWLSWMRWLSVFYYGSRVLLINEFQGLKFCLGLRSNVCPITGNQVLDRQGIDHGSPWDLWKHLLALTLLTMACFILAFIQLLRIRKTTWILISTKHHSFSERMYLIFVYSRNLTDKDMELLIFLLWRHLSHDRSICTFMLFSFNSNWKCIFIKDFFRECGYLISLRLVNTSI